MKNLVFSLLVFLFSITMTYGQYYKEHHIAPAPWQYWSDANEIVVGTIAEEDVNVDLFKSNGDFIVTLTVSKDNPVSYRFVGSPFDITRNAVDQTYSDRGLLVKATEPVLVNLRNIASDTKPSIWGSEIGPNNIKGNASLVSFGEEGMGVEFRLGYYRESVIGLFSNRAVYSVLAIDDATTINLPNAAGGVNAVILDAGESRLFFAPLGSLMTSDKPVAVNVGSWGDNPETCGGNGQDGTFDQVAPVHVLGRQYLVVRGDGTHPATTFQENSKYGPEQSMIVASEAETTVVIENYDVNGVLVGLPVTVPLNNAGDFYSFYHGDKANKYSSSLIKSDKPIIVYAGTAVDCETDISTVLPIGQCAGSTNVQTKKFIGYDGGNLPYFGFSIIEDADVPVFLNDVNIEDFVGVVRKPLGDSGFYIISFTNVNIDSPENLVLSSAMPLTSSLVQQGGGFSMSAFFSAFGEAAKAPIVVTENEDCTITIQAEEGGDIIGYEWFKDGVSIAETEDSSLVIKSSGNYAVRLLKDCGWGNLSLPSMIEVSPCSDLSITKEVGEIGDGVVEFEVSVINLGPVYDEVDVVVNELLPNGYEFISAMVSAGVYDEEVNQWLLPSLGVGVKEFLTLKVKILPDGDYNNVVEVRGTNRDPFEGNNTASARITNEKFTFTKIALDREYHDIGDVIEYSMVIKNIGTNPLKNIVVEDANADVGSVIPSIISHLESNAEVEIVAKHTITEVEYRLAEVVNQAVATADAVTGKIVMKSDDPSTSKPEDPTVTILNREADLDAIKDDGRIYYFPGESTEYNISITNNGPTSALDVQILDLMPDGIKTMAWTTNTGESGNGNIEFMVPVIGVDETIKITSFLEIPKDFKGDLINTVSFSSEIKDPNPVCTRCVDMNIETVVIPKGISPNADGKNDYLDLSRYHVSELRIYNRYGTLVYEKEKYSNEWSGQSLNGNLLPSGTYYYYIAIETGDVLSGWIQLVH